MPRPSKVQDSVQESVVEKKLTAYSVIIAGQDVSILAEDEEDLRRQIEKRR